MRHRALLAAAVAAMAYEGMPALPAPIPGEPRRDPYEPETRRRRAQMSPAQRLLERQRQRNLQRSKP
jgi:hypothetical protein